MRKKTILVLNGENYVLWWKQIAKSSPVGLQINFHFPKEFVHINIHEPPWKAMGDFYKAVSGETNTPPPLLCSCADDGGVVSSWWKTLTIHDLSILKQRFAQLTTFKCHPTAKSAYQRQALHRNEGVCGGIIFLPLFHPDAAEWGFFLGF